MFTIRIKSVIIVGGVNERYLMVYTLKEDNHYGKKIENHGW